jgi:hypothetical protein
VLEDGGGGGGEGSAVEEVVWRLRSGKVAGWEVVVVVVVEVAGEDRIALIRVR